MLAKRIATKQKHSISFEIAYNAFFDPFLTSLEDEIIDGELRHTAIGMINARIYWARATG